MNVTLVAQKNPKQAARPNETVSEEEERSVAHFFSSASPNHKGEVEAKG